MPIFDQGYQHWHGELGGPPRRWWSIARRGAVAGLKNRWMRWVLLLSLAPALLLATVLSLWGLLEQQTAAILAFVAQFLPSEVVADPKTYRTMVWTLAFDFFFTFETMLAAVLVLMIGPDLISQDLRFNAMPLYFSKPVRRIDYFIGKLGTIGAFIAGVMVAPAILAYVLGVAFSLDFSVVRDTWRLFLASMGYGLIVAVSGGTIMLAISSLARNSRMVASMWMGFLVASAMFSAVMVEQIDQPWCQLVSYWNNVHRVQSEVLGTHVAWKHVADLQDTINKRLQAAAALASARQGITGLLGGGGPPPPPVPPDVKPKEGRRRRGMESPGFRSREEWEAARGVSQKTFFEKLAEEPFPWQWSAYVLLGLFGVSACILSLRVRSLDKLR